MKKQDSLPCYTTPYLDRILFYTDNRIDRDFVIWDQYTNAEGCMGRTQREIAEMVGCSQSVVNHALLVLRELGGWSNIMEYFMLGFELCDIFSANGYEIDKYVTNVLHSLLRHGIQTREQIINMSHEELKDFLLSRTMKRAGNVACDIFREYYVNKQVDKQLNYILKGRN